MSKSSVEARVLGSECPVCRERGTFACEWTEIVETSYSGVETRDDVLTIKCTNCHMRGNWTRNVY